MTSAFFPGKKPGNKKSNNPDINLNIKKIKLGDRLLREDFIKSYKPFIVKSVSNLVGKYIEVENSDEYSIGLSAFNEAIDCYDDTKSVSFLSFSRMIISRRITDYIRCNTKYSRTYPFTYFEKSEKSLFEFEESYLKTEPDFYNSREVSKEVALFEDKLKEFGITMDDLVVSAPKHRDSKQLCVNIARVIGRNRELFTYLESKKCIPKTQLLKLAKVNKKTIERNRKFIIAASLIIGNGFYSLKEFIDID